MPIGDALLKSFLYSPSDIFTDGTAFLLGKGCENGHHQFPIPAHGMDILFFEPDLDPLFFQLSYCLEKVDSISREALYEFGDDDVNLPSFCICYHPQETSNCSAMAFPVIPCSSRISLTLEVSALSSGAEFEADVYGTSSSVKPIRKSSETPSFNSKLNQSF